MSSRYLIPLAVAAALAAPVAAHAQEGTYDPGKWLVRVGMSQINPERKTWKFRAPSLVVDSDVTPTGTVEYMITPHIGTELLLAWPATHGIDLKGFAPNTDSRVGHVDVLPPTLSLNWHFNPNGMFRPYIGAGVNYTMFSGEETRGDARRHRVHARRLDRRRRPGRCRHRPAQLVLQRERPLHRPVRRHRSGW